MRVLRLKSKDITFFEATVGNERVIRILNEEHQGASFLFEKIKGIYSKEKHEGLSENEVLVLNLMSTSKFSFSEALSTLNNCSNCTIFIDNLDWLRDSDQVNAIENLIKAGTEKGNTYFVVTNKGFITIDLLKLSRDYKLLSWGHGNKRVWSLEFSR